MKSLRAETRKAKVGFAAIMTALVLSVPYTKVHALDYLGAGPNLSLVIAEHIGAGLGVGGHMLFGFDLNRFGQIHIYPNIAFWFGHEDFGWWTGRAPYDYATQVDLWVFELTFNFDTRYYFPLPPSVPIAPYVGLGFCPVVTIYQYEPGWWGDYHYYDGRDYYYYHHSDGTDIGPGFNFFAGLDIPIGMNKFFFEMRGKVGDGYELLKLTGGFSFTIR